MSTGDRNITGPKVWIFSSWGLEPAEGRMATSRMSNGERLILPPPIRDWHQQGTFGLLWVLVD